MARSNFNQNGIAEKNSKSVFKRSALSIALGLCVAGGVQAQSTTGSIYGDAPAGSTVTITNNSGFSRTVTVDASGYYNVRSLPVGTYTVTAKDGDETVGSYSVPVRLGSGSDASFGGNDMMENVVVTGERMRAIDMGSTDTRVVLTAEELNRMPIGRSAEAIALLAPGVNGGSTTFTNNNMVSFGGAGVTENAYYINGFLANDPLSNLGGFSLPFGSIEQQETFTGGYRAKYGRSSGGVLNQIGARGDNEFRYGTQVTFEPKGLRGSGAKGYFQDKDLPEGYGYQNPELVGQLYERSGDDYRLSNTYSGYVSGPLIEDKLFGFLSYESEMEDYQNSATALSALSSVEKGDRDTSKIYTKLDWNITEDHLLDFTYMSEKEDYEGTFNAYDVETGDRGERMDLLPNEDGHKSEFTILNYTGFLTDTLTLNAMYGRGDFTYYDKPAGDVSSPFISGVTNQDPLITQGSQVEGLAGGYQARDAKDTTEGIRVDLEWQLGDHVLTFGIDNMEFEAENEGVTQVTDRWIYARSDTPSEPIVEGLGVGAPGDEGYYAYKYFYQTATSMKVKQDAYYLEDRWQVTDDVLLSLGLRNDKFTNYNSDGTAYLESDDQWAPRLGAAWDVFGDSSLKLFANAGRYYLAMPNGVAIRGASASTFTREYFTYTGIAEDGSPTGLTALGPGPVSSNGELGQTPDPRAFAPADLENMYQDEYLVGFEKTMWDDYVVGAKFTFRDLKSGIDDVCDPDRFLNKLDEMGVDAGTVDWQYCYMFNPGGTNTFSLANLDANGNPDGTRTEVTMTKDDWEMPSLKRQYSAIDLFMERPFDGKWEARLDYTYSKLQGNMEGQVKSEFGQEDISKTQDWDASEIMRFSDGYLANDRRHQLKLRGSYALTEELLLSANASIKSGMPVSCLGFFDPDGTGASDPDPIHYGSSYHTCFGGVAEPGKERTPWTRNLDLALTYTPAFMDDKLRLGLQVFNVTNEQEPLQLQVRSETGSHGTVRNDYNVPMAYQTPRYMMLTATLNF